MLVLTLGMYNRWFQLYTKFWSKQEEQNPSPCKHVKIIKMLFDRDML
jgi:hypothetical protein